MAQGNEKVTIQKTHLKKNLQNATPNSKSSCQKDEKWNHQLNEMIDQSFTLVEYLWRLVHKITHRIWHWLSLSKIGRIFFLGLHPLFQLMEGHQN